MLAASVRTRPKRSASGPQMNDSPQPIRNSANRIEPYIPRFAGVAAMPEAGSNSVSAGISTSA